MALRSIRSVRPLQNATRAYATWGNVKMGPPDPILGVSVAFQADKSDKKMNLGVGAYRDDNNKPFVLECVRKAEMDIAGKLNHEYAGITGIPDFCKEAAVLAFGNDNKALQEGRVFSSQTISGTGANRLASAFFSRHYEQFGSERKIHVPNPTWGNHIPIIKDAGLDVAYYKYYDPKTKGLDFEGMISSLDSMQKGSVVLLHACAHNPTGVDPTAEQWEKIREVFKAKGHVAFIDMAYQGFASGDASRDALALRSFVDADIPVVACQSFAKNMGLYGERCGAIHFVCSSDEELKCVKSQAEILIRPMYSNPPIFGARIAHKILSDPALNELWLSEVKGMADRIIRMRAELTDGLKAAGSKHDWSHINKQIGMFCFSGLKPEMCDALASKHHVYLTRNGRISMAGVTSATVEYLAHAIHDVSKDAEL